MSARFNANAALELPRSYVPKQAFNDAGQVSFEEIAMDLPQARFLTGLGILRPSSTYLKDAHS